jgi:hypothetical protein
LLTLKKINLKIFTWIGVIFLLAHCDVAKADDYRVDLSYEFTEGAIVFSCTAKASAGKLEIYMFRECRQLAIAALNAKKAQGFSFETEATDNMFGGAKQLDNFKSLNLTSLTLKSTPIILEKS